MTMEKEKTADKKGTVDSVKAFGKGMEPWGAPFSISRQRGLYYYVPAEHFDRLREINELAGKDGLPELKVIGRGGMSGNRPFALGGGLYLCILAEHARRLQEINAAYSAMNSQGGSTDSEGKIRGEGREDSLWQTERGDDVSVGFAAEKEEEKFMPAIAEEGRGEVAADKPETAPTTVQEVAPVLKRRDSLTQAATMAVQEQRQTSLTAEEMRDGDKKKKQRSEGRYVYCIIKADGKTKSFGKIGLGSEEVYCIDYKNVSAVVSDFEGIDCGLSEENARVHNAVISQVMKRSGSVLPVGFGAVFASGKILKGVLGKTYHALKEEMKGVENKAELGIKIVANKGAKSPANNTLSEEALNVLGKIAAKTHKGKAFMDRMLLNASFLVELSRIDEFSRQVEELEKKYSDAVKIQYTGPWPPYNFVSVRIGADTDGGG